MIGFCRNGSFGLSWLNLGSLDFLLQSVPLFPFPAPIGSKTLVKLRSGCARAGGRCQRLAGNSTGWEMPPLYFLCSCLTKMNICIIFNEKRKKKNHIQKRKGWKEPLCLQRAMTARLQAAALWAAQPGSQTQPQVNNPRRKQGWQVG